MTGPARQPIRKQGRHGPVRDRLPAGVTLPDGTYLSYPPERDCGCETCIRAFEAYRAGELRLPKEDGLPW